MRAPHPSRRSAPRRAALSATSLAPPALLAGLLALVLAACSPHRELYPRLDELARQGNYAQAARLVEESADDYGERNAVLWHLDRGIFYHYAGQYEKSNEAFQEAERRIDELFSRSVSGEVGAFLMNDNTLPYRGEDFEGVIVNIYRALNYVKLGDIEAALVEARKVDQKLVAINSHYDEGEKNVYRSDAFARFLTGVFYEMGGTRDDLNDAYIADKLAVESYSEDFSHNYGVDTPRPLKVNLLTHATFMGRQEVNEATGRFPGVELIPLGEKRRQAEVYVVHFAGRAPVKVEDALSAVAPDGNLIKVAFPRYQRVPYRITGSRITVDGEPAATLEVAQPTGDIAIENLDNRKGRIAAKAIARAITKYQLNRKLQEEGRERGPGAELFGFLAGNIYAAVSEQADLRSWQTLPDRMLVGRVLLEPGTHKLAVQYLADGGAPAGRRNLGEVTLAPGETRFFIVHTNW